MRAAVASRSRPARRASSTVSASSVSEAACIITMAIVRRTPDRVGPGRVRIVNSERRVTRSRTGNGPCDGTANENEWTASRLPELRPEDRPLALRVSRRRRAPEHAHERPLLLEAELVEQLEPVASIGRHVHDDGLSEIADQGSHDETGGDLEIGRDHGTDLPRARAVPPETVPGDDAIAVG